MKNVLLATAAVIAIAAATSITATRNTQASECIGPKPATPPPYVCQQPKEWRVLCVADPGPRKEWKWVCI